MTFPPPPIIAPPLEDYEFFYNGLTFGDTTPWGVLKVEGLDLAEIRSGDVNWSRDHGQAIGLDLYGGRDVIIDFWVKSDGTSVQHALAALAAASVVRPDEELPLWFKLPNLSPLCVMCRPRSRPMTIDSDYAAANIGKPTLTLHATDPRIYSVATDTPLVMNEPPATPTTVEIDNTGNTEMRPIVIFDGPIARPKIGSDVAGTPYMEIIDTDADEAEAVVNEAYFLRVLRQWESETKNLHEWEEAPTYKVGEEVQLSFFTFHERWLCIKENAGEKPKAGSEDWEKVGGFGEEGNRTRGEIEAKEAALHGEQEAAEAAAQAARQVEEEKGELPTVKTGDQLLVDFSIPHRAVYYPGGIEANEPEDVMRWLTSASIWWDIVPSTQKVSFSSIDEKATAGAAELQWASATQL